MTTGMSCLRWQKPAGYRRIHRDFGLTERINGDKS